MSTSIIAATNPHKGTTTSSPFAYSLDSVIQATVTNPVGGLVTPCQVTLQLSADGGITYQSIDSKRGGMGDGDGSLLLLVFRLSDYAGKAIWTHARLVFSGNTAQSRLGVTVSAVGDGATWGGGAGTGTVTSVSVVTANGYSGTVANPTTTPAITISGPVSVGGAWLMSTAVKTANYTAAPGDFVPVDSVANAVTITLPAAPADGSVVAVKAFAWNNSIGVVPGGSDVIDNGAVLLGPTFPRQCWLFLYRAVGARWYVVAESSPSDQMDLRYRNASNIWDGTIGTAFLPRTGLTITQHAGAIIVPSGTSGTITMDLSLGDWQAPAAVTGAFTLALSNPTTGQQFTVVLTQAASGGPYAVTWFGGITWMGSPYTAPTMPATASAKLSATFKCISAGVYLGYWLGNSAA